MDSGNRKRQMTGHALGRHSPTGGCPIQTDLSHEQAGLQHLVGKVLCLNSQAKHDHVHVILAAKRLAIFLDWAGSGSPHQHLARTYDVSKAAVCNIIHDVVFILCKEFVPSMISFPEGDDLLRVIDEFSGLCSLPCCAPWALPLGATLATYCRCFYVCSSPAACASACKEPAWLFPACLPSTTVSKSPKPSTEHRYLCALSTT
jgi:hypothetical protein